MSFSQLVAAQGEVAWLISSLNNFIEGAEEIKKYQFEINKLWESLSKEK